MHGRDPRALLKEQVAQRRRTVAVVGIASFAFCMAAAGATLLAGRAVGRRAARRFGY